MFCMLGTNFGHMRASCFIYCYLMINPWWQVKLVKCLVQNIVVDISVNQIGGLCTLCFLEKVIFQMLP